MFTVTAARAMEHGGRTLAPGDELKVTATEALALKYRGDIRIGARRRIRHQPDPTTPVLQTAAMTPVEPEPEPVADEPAPPVKRRVGRPRKYQTTDIKESETTDLTPPSGDE